MTVKEFEQEMKQIEDKQNSLFDKAKKMYKDKVLDVNEYLKLEEKPIFWHSTSEILSLKKNNIDINDLDIEDVIKELEDFRREYKNAKKKNLIGLSEIEEDKWASNECVEEFGFRYEYYELSSEKNQLIIQKLKRKKMSELLKPKSEKSPTIPDCKMVELFTNGTIDWKTLQTITYQTCDA